MLTIQATGRSPSGVSSIPSGKSPRPYPAAVQDQIHPFSLTSNRVVLRATVSLIIQRGTVWSDDDPVPVVEASGVTARESSAPQPRTANHRDTSCIADAPPSRIRARTNPSSRRPGSAWVTRRGIVRGPDRASGSTGSSEAHGLRTNQRGSRGRPNRLQEELQTQRGRAGPRRPLHEAAPVARRAPFRMASRPSIPVAALSLQEADSRCVMHRCEHGVA